MSQGANLIQQWRTRKDGTLLHDGDCNFWALSFCDCGLLRALSCIGFDRAEKLYPSFSNHWALHYSVRDELAIGTMRGAHRRVVSETKERLALYVTPAGQKECNRILREAGFDMEDC